jgi:hypothetical protein
MGIAGTIELAKVSYSVLFPSKKNNLIPNSFAKKNIK